MPNLDNTQIIVVNDSLEYPEGPIHCNDGGIILVEIKGEKLTHVSADGTTKTLASIKGGPNGAAVGPDGCIYICNDGGFEWTSIPNINKNPILVGGDQPANYTGGKLQKVDPATGSVTDVFTQCSEREFPVGSTDATAAWSPPFKLCGPDDLVFDELGGYWFSDFGKTRERDRDITGVYYVSPDGKTITQKIYPLNSPNGIALSPDGKRLYVALTYERKIVYYELSEPGKISPNTIKGPNSGSLDGSYLLTANLEGQAILDSMAIDAEGNVYVATMLPNGANPMTNGGISVISPDGDIEFISIKLPGTDFSPLPSNICFGGPDMKTAFVTCGAAGYLLKMPAKVAGLKLNFNGSEFELPESKG